MIGKSGVYSGMFPVGLEPGTVVTSVRGRDRGRSYVVTKDLGERYVLVADGRVRTLERPKKKNVRHLVRHGQIVPTLSNEYIRRALACWESETIKEVDAEVCQSRT
jgi:ribosomal protein L14E/L6E/L27E